MNKENGASARFDSIRDNVKGIVEQGQEKVHQFKDRVVDVRDQAMSKGTAFLDNASEWIKAHPLKAVGIAFGVGYLGMRLFRR